MKKFLLCRPRGGLNDLLNQCWKCYRYASDHQRLLVIDTQSTAYSECLGRYFTSSVPNLKFISDSDVENILHSIENTVFPDLSPETLGSYTGTYVKDFPAFVSTSTKKLLTFDFSRSYDQDVLLHDSSGGGADGHRLLGLLRVSEEIKKELKRRLSLLSENYYSIHVRNTDYKTDFVDFINSILREISGRNVFISTDSSEVVRYCKHKLGSKCFSFSETLSDDDWGLHSRSRPNKHLTLNKDAILDLFTLAASKKLFFTKVNDGVYSGFSILAYSLFLNKEILGAVLLDGECRSLVSHDDLQRLLFRRPSFWCRVTQRMRAGFALGFSKLP